VQGQATSSSTAITSVYILRPKPQPSPDKRDAAGAARVSKSEFKAGDLIPGTRYRVLGLLGRGGMGSVYEVEHTELGKRFVLKALLSQLSSREDLVARLRNEQRALGRLEHPNIVNVTDAGVTSTNVPYFVMERLDGETLGARLKRAGTVPISDALEIAAAVLEGLAAAHEIGVVHRDIKPQNIFLHGPRNPKILDFGVAKITDNGAITARGVAVGTPRYMSPEQASGDPLDGRSDIYAVGLLLFESMAGHGPFDDARDANEMLLAHLSWPPPRLSSRARGVTPDLEAYVASLLAKRPGQRPSKARDVAASLRVLAAPYVAAPAAGVGSHTVRLQPGLESPPTTHADGVAARHAWSAREGATEDAKTLARIAGAPPGSDTLIDDQDTHFAATSGSSFGDNSTLRDFSGVGPTTRTEILSVVDAGGPNDLPTHTKVPLTPTNGSRTLDPVPVAPVAKRSGPRALMLASVGFFALGAGALGTMHVLREGPARAEPAAAAAPVVTALPKTSPAVTATVGVLTPPERVTPPASSVSRASPPAVPPAPAAQPAPARAPGSTAAVARQDRPKKAKTPASLRIPDGLPSSGL
jgi:serine/threonine-protein kinase